MNLALMVVMVVSLETFAVPEAAGAKAVPLKSILVDDFRYL